jgi:hypothetical protein
MDRLASMAVFMRRQEEIIRGQWRQLGTCLVERFPGIAEDAETLGALLHEIAYAPAMTVVSTPTAGALAPGDDWHSPEQKLAVLILRGTGQPPVRSSFAPMAALGPGRVKTPNLVFSLGVRGDRDEAFC